MAAASELVEGSALRSAGRGVVTFSMLLGVGVVSALLVMSRPTNGDADSRDVIRLSSRDIEVASLGDTDDDEHPMAVLVDDGRMLVTTSKAVGDQRRLSVRLTDGRVHDVEVVHVDRRASIALLVLPMTDDRSLSTIPESQPVRIGQEVIVLTQTPHRLRVVSYGNEAMLEWGLAGVDDDDVVEGAPVIDRSGRLIGISTHTSNGVAVIPIELVAAAIRGFAVR
jgi:S1-C subfamily serine protease